MWYCEWYRSRVRTQRQKEQYELARDVKLFENALDLELVEDNDADFESARFGAMQSVIDGVTGGAAPDD